MVKTYFERSDSLSVSRGSTLADLGDSQTDDNPNLFGSIRIGTADEFETVMDQGDSVLDVRDISGPPFGEIMDALDDLERDETLELIAPFEPRPLFGVLSERSYSFEATQVDEDEWRVLITPAEA